MKTEIQNQIYWIHARGRVLGHDFKVFQREGIPALEKVANYLKISIPELKKLTLEGKLRSSTFLKALNIEAGPQGTDALATGTGEHDD